MGRTWNHVLLAASKAGCLSLHWGLITFDNQLVLWFLLVTKGYKKRNTFLQAQKGFEYSPEHTHE